jgi:hypothetical protein
MLWFLLALISSAGGDGALAAVVANLLYVLLMQDTLAMKALGSVGQRAAEPGSQNKTVFQNAPSPA